jgi:hypothetical protein
MTSVTRFGAALCLALVLHLLSVTQSAGGDPPFPVNGFSAPAPEPQGPQGNEVLAINVCVPKTSAGFEASASLLLLQPASSNLMYGTLVNPFPFLSPHWQDQAVRPEFSPGFNVAMRYAFDGGGNVQLDWTHLNARDTALAHTNMPLALEQLSGPSSIQALGPPFLIGPPVPYSSAVAVAHFGYDSVNLQAELLLNVGCHVQVRTFAGLQGTSISESLSTSFRSVDGALGFNDSSKSEFTGVGPRLGMELHYCTGNLELLGGIAGATLIGQRQSHMDFYAVSPLNTASGLTPNVQTLTSPNMTQVIPCIDAKLAASYTIPLGNFGILKCEAGYQATVYFNVINQYSLTEVENTLVADQPKTPETTGSAVFLRTAAEIQSNFMVHGPFIKLSLEF